MVQGKTKGLQTKAPSQRHAAKAASNTKKGKRYVPPKKTSLVKQASMHKVCLHFNLQLTSASSNLQSSISGARASLMCICCSICYYQELTAKINKSIEQQMVSAASAGKLTIMKNVAPEA
jgi:hypothetical protein